MIIGNIDYSKKLFFIIEEGQFNLGDFDKALLMIELASITGANAIEFQLAYAADFYIVSDQGYHNYISREFTDEQLQKLVSCAHKNNLQFISTCLSHKLVDKMKKFGTDAYNINACDINNPTMISSVLSTGKPFFVSMPLASKQEVEWVVNYISEENITAKFGLLHGQHPMASGSESVELEDTSLGFLRAASHSFERPVGFIDHTPFFWMPSVAVGAGATIISKHMTASHAFKGPDHSICLDPKEMKEAVRLANDTFSSMLICEKVRAKGEDMDIALLRRSLVSARFIRKGETITANDILFKRPGTGIPLDALAKAEGRTAACDIAADILLTPEMFS